jgi:phage baseplate assembly protein W
MAALSDKSNSTNVSIKRQYRDISLSFLKHPGTGDVRPLTDIDAVKQSVKNLILTNFGDRPFQFDIGSNVTSLLFEPASNFTAQAIKTEILECLRTKEPRINGTTVRITDNSDRNSYVISLYYNVISLNLEVESSFYLRRLR